jgi:hypothetical protein
MISKPLIDWQEYMVYEKHRIKHPDLVEELKRYYKDHRRYEEIFDNFNKRRSEWR